MTRDRLYDTPRAEIVDFVFDDAVARAFPDMIRRSVPGYETVIPMTGLIAARHATDGCNLYDLGCSLGATSAATLQYLDARNCRVIAVDNAEAMVRGAREVLGKDLRATVVQADVRDVPIERAGAVVLNYTLQFVPREERARLLARIRLGLEPTGVLLLSEKVIDENGADQPELDELHLAWKRANGYSDLEVAQKRSALERVLLADSLKTHRERLHGAGFSRVLVWFRCLNWASMIAWP
jgi:tRNA (cmo5U34)-methyltransferase